MVSALICCTLSTWPGWTEEHSWLGKLCVCVYGHKRGGTGKLSVNHPSLPSRSGLVHGGRGARGMFKGEQVELENKQCPAALPGKRGLVRPLISSSWLKSHSLCWLCWWYWHRGWGFSDRRVGLSSSWCENVLLHSGGRSRGFSRETELEYFILLLLGFSTPPHRDQHGTKNPLWDDRYIQHVIHLPVRQVCKVEPPGLFLQNYSPQCSSRGLDCATLDMEA